MIGAFQFPLRIHDLARNDRNLRLFGAERHKYKLGPCLTDVEVEELEASYGVEFPGGYRMFLTRVGNGGAGPGYGLETLRPPSNATQPSNRTLSNSSNAAEPFPLTEPYRSITDEMLGLQDSNWDNQARYDFEVRRSAFSDLAFGHGVLKMANYDSGIYAVLILDGPFRGEVWIVDPNLGEYVPASMRTDLYDSSLIPEQAYKLPRQPSSFVRWYNHWLVSAQREIENDSAS